MTSLSMRYVTDAEQLDRVSSPTSSLFRHTLLSIWYAAINAYLAALYKGRRAWVEMPNLWSLIQKTVSEGLHSDTSDSARSSTDSGRKGVPASALSATNWDGWINPTSSLDTSEKFKIRLRKRNNYMTGNGYTCFFCDFVL